MTTKIFYASFALCLIAQPIPATNLVISKPSALDHIDAVSSSKNHLSNQEIKNNNLQIDEKQEDTLEEGIAKYLPQFFQNNKPMLEKLQQGNRQAVLVIGQTGVGKSTLIGGLLGHKFVFEEHAIRETLGDIEMCYEKQLLINKTPGAPTIHHSLNRQHTTFPQAYLHPQTDLVFIDTPEISDTNKHCPTINLCNAIALRSLIEAIGNLQAIIGVIDYNTFKTGKSANAFTNLLSITSSLLKNKSLATCTSSLVLAFTKVPNNITKHYITKQFKKQCFNLIKTKKKNQITPEHNRAENIYRLLFPSYHGLKNKKDIPFFLISQASILKQGFLSNNILPTLQKATNVDKRDIGLVLSPYLLDKTTDWLTKKAAVLANYIKHKAKIQNNILHLTTSLTFNKTQLLHKQNLLQQLTDLNNEDIQNKKAHLVKHLQHTIQKNTQQIQQLNLKIQDNHKQFSHKLKEIMALNTHQIEFYKNISGTYDAETNTYHYTYHDLPINYIIYTSNNPKKDPKPNASLDDYYKIVSITKNYSQGILNITLQKKIHKVSALFQGFQTFFLPMFESLHFKSTSNASKYVIPYYFKIYAKKQHIYRSKIHALRDDIENLQEHWLKLKCKKIFLQKETRTNQDALDKVKLSLLNQEHFIQKINKGINIKNQEVKKLQLHIDNFHNQLNQLNQKLKQDAIIPYIITQVAPFILFTYREQHSIDVCTQYMNCCKKNKQGNYDRVQIKENHNNEKISSSTVTSSIALGTTIVFSTFSKRKG